jgi:hypothetical protein
MTAPAEGTPAATTATNATFVAPTTSTSINGLTYTGGTTTTGIVLTPSVPAGAPATATGGQEPPAAPNDAQAPSGLPDDPDALKAEITRLRRENASARTTAKQNAAEEARSALATELGKVLGLVDADKPVDPNELTKQLGEHQQQAAQARRDLAVYQLASGAGADPNAVLDSYSFRMAIAQIDPADTAAIGEAIKAAVAVNPALAAQPVRRVPAPNPALGSSSNGAPDTEALIAEAQKKGDWKTVIALQNQKLADLAKQQ